MASAILLQDTVTTLNDSAVRLVYEGTTTGTKTITVPEVTARMVTGNTTAYDNDTSTFIANTLASGAIIERGSNANGSYVKYADGTLICKNTPSALYTHSATSGAVYYVSLTLTFPAVFIASPEVAVNSSKNSGTGITWAGGASLATTTTVSFWSIGSVLNSISQISYIAIGSWK